MIDSYLINILVVIVSFIPAITVPFGVADIYNFYGFLSNYVIISDLIVLYFYVKNKTLVIKKSILLILIITIFYIFGENLDELIPLKVYFFVNFLVLITSAILLVFYPSKLLSQKKLNINTYHLILFFSAISSFFSGNLNFTYSFLVLGILIFFKWGNLKQIAATLIFLTFCSKILLYFYHLIEKLNLDIFLLKISVLTSIFLLAVTDFTAIFIYFMKNTFTIVISVIVFAVSYIWSGIAIKSFSLNTFRIIYGLILFIVSGFILLLIFHNLKSFIQL